jgi:hypothetical protein
MSKFVYKLYNHNDHEYVVGYYDSMAAAVQGLAKMLNTFVSSVEEELNEGTKPHTEHFHYNIDKIELKELK